MICLVWLCCLLLSVLLVARPVFSKLFMKKNRPLKKMLLYEKIRSYNRYENNSLNSILKPYLQPAFIVCVILLAAAAAGLPLVERVFDYI